MWPVLRRFTHDGGDNRPSISLPPRCFTKQWPPSSSALSFSRLSDHHRQWTPRTQSRVSGGEDRRTDVTASTIRTPRRRRVRRPLWPSVGCLFSWGRRARRRPAFFLQMTKLSERCQSVCHWSLKFGRGRTPRPLLPHEMSFFFGFLLAAGASLVTHTFFGYLKYHTVCT